MKIASGMLLALALAAALPLSAQASQQDNAPAGDSSVSSAEPMPLADRGLVLAIADGDQRAIAVGERGHVFVSESRQDWRQVADVPTRSTLTAVAAAGNRAWAVGHDQVIIHSADGGLTWVRQRAQPFDPDNVDDPRNGAPLLDVLFLDENRGFAVGAYGLLLRTDDAGATWERVDLGGGAASDEVPAEDEASEDWTFSEEDLELDAETDPHLNAIVRTGDGSLLVPAERGAAFRSVDGGATWERTQLPYEGSMFGAIGYAGRRVLVFGLRGNAFESDDLGDTWRTVETGVELTLQGGDRLGENGAVIVGNDGLVLVRGDDGQLQRRKAEDAGVLSDVLPVGGSGQVVIVGENGIARFVAQ